MRLISKIFGRKPSAQGRGHDRAAGGMAIAVDRDGQFAIEARMSAQQRDPTLTQPGQLVAVVEVRTRGSTALEGAFESIGPTKRARLRKAVDRLWRETLEAMKDVERVRIDAAAVTFEGGVTSVEYVEGAIG